MEKKTNKIINACIVGLICCTVMGIMSVALNLIILYRLAFSLFICVYAFSIRKYSTNENSGRCIRKVLKSYMWILIVVAFAGFLNTYAEWFATESLLKGFRVLVISIFPIEAIYLARIKKCI